MPRLRLSKMVITGAAALALVGGGTAAGAAIAASPIDSSGVIHGCWSNGAINGSHVFVLQDAGTSCPRGTTAISWKQAGAQGSQGPAGPQGPAGATGQTGPQGPAGNAGPAGTNGTGATVASLAAGDPNCLTGGASVTDGNEKTAYACNGAPGPAGPKGDTGPAGPPGPAGTNGISGSVADLGNLTCISSGGANGTVQVNTASDDSVSLKCVPLSTDANCTHSDGLGDNYTDCNDLLGTPGDESTYNVTMANDAAAAFLNSHVGGHDEGVVANPCLVDSNGDQGQAVLIAVVNPETGAETDYYWIFTSLDAGTVTGGVTSGGCSIGPSNWT